MHHGLLALSLSPWLVSRDEAPRTCFYNSPIFSLVRPVPKKLMAACMASTAGVRTLFCRNVSRSATPLRIVFRAMHQESLCLGCLPHKERPRRKSKEQVVPPHSRTERFVVSQTGDVRGTPVVRWEGVHFRRLTRSQTFRIGGRAEYYPRMRRQIVSAVSLRNYRFFAVYLRGIYRFVYVCVVRLPGGRGQESRTSQAL